jgi:hypothetical protein
MSADASQWVLLGCGVAALLFIVVAAIIVARAAFRLNGYARVLQRSPIFAQLTLLQIFRTRINNDLAAMRALKPRLERVVNEMDRAIALLRLRETIAVVRTAQMAVKLLRRTL